jgi:two-component system nitrogen regulation sensor histidine kinase NtrY
MEVGDQVALITISDNGIGLPADRARLFEPYVTTREKGTGLGLPIVKKIIEEHGGTLLLTDADPFEPGARRGARAEIRLPLAAQATQTKDQKLAV